MANRAYLLNTQFAISDPQLLQKKLSEPGNDYAEVAEAAYKIPIPWLCCFRQADLQTFPYRLGDDDDGNVMQVALPVTSKRQALANLRSTLPIFEMIAGDSKLGLAYWQDAIDLLQALPLPYLSIDPLEVMFSVDPEEFAQQLHAALAGDQSAVPDLKSLSCYEDGALPYPQDVLYAVPGPNHDPKRIANTVALDSGGGGGRYFWHLASGSPARARESTAQPEASGRLDLVSINQGIKKVLSNRQHAASTSFSFTPPVPALREQLKLLIVTKTNAERDAVLQDRTLIDALLGLLQRDLQTVCEEYRFDWLGYVITSREYLQGNVKKDLNDWVDLPVFTRDEPRSPPPAPPSPPTPPTSNQPAAPQPAPAPTPSSDTEIAGTEMVEAPRLWGVSTNGRIGRLRFLAFYGAALAVFLIAGLGAVTLRPISAILGGLLLISGSVLAIWLAARALVMRMHDLNLSGKWMLALLLLPGFAAAFQLSGGALLGAGLFWLGLLGVVAWPGSATVNAYAPPCGPEPTWVRVTGFICLALMPLSLCGLIAQRWMAPNVRRGTLPVSVPALAASSSNGSYLVSNPDGAVPAPVTTLAPPPPPTVARIKSWEDDLPPPTHGGQVFGKRFLNYEVVVKGRVVTVYLTEQDHGYDLSDATGEVTYRFPKMIRHVPLLPLGPDRMRATIPDDPFEPGDDLLVRIEPKSRAGSHFEVDVPGPEK